MLRQERRVRVGILLTWGEIGVSETLESDASGSFSERSGEDRGEGIDSLKVNCLIFATQSCQRVE